MKLTTISLAFLLIIVFTLSSCGGQSPASTPVEIVSTTEPAAAPSVEDQASLIMALQSAGATAEVVDTISQPFFTLEGVFITINGEEDIQVFEYEDVQAMESEASQVAPNGGSVGTSMMMWVDTPHFYKSGRIIVLYIGNNTEILGLLNEVMGPQFAGQ